MLGRYAWVRAPRRRDLPARPDRPPANRRDGGRPLVLAGGAEAAERFIDFFTSNIRNRHTREDGAPDKTTAGMMFS